MNSNQQLGAHGPKAGRIPVDGKPFPYTIKHAFREGEFVTESEKVEVIIDHACELFGVTRSLLFSKTRNGKLVNARVLISNAMHQLTDLTYPAIGKLLHRDHSTIIYYVNRAHRPFITADGNHIPWPPTWVAMEIMYIKQRLGKEPPAWQLLRDLGEALGFLNPKVAAIAGVSKLAKVA